MKEARERLRMSIRIDKDDYDFVKGLANEEKEDLSSAVRSLTER